MCVSIGHCILIGNYVSFDVFQQANHEPALETNPDSFNFKMKPHQDPDTVSAHLRRKLSFTNKNGTHCGSADDTALSGGEGVRRESPLPPMPDLSQPSPPRSSLSLLPSASQVSRLNILHRFMIVGRISFLWFCFHLFSMFSFFFDQESDSPTDLKQELNPDSPDDEPSESNSQHLRLSRDLPSTSKASRILPCTSESSLSLTCPDQSQFTQQQSTSYPKTPVFTRTDVKERFRLNDKVSHNTTPNSFPDSVHKLADSEASPIHKRSRSDVRVSVNRLSRSGKPQPLAKDLTVKQVCIGSWFNMYNM